MPITLTTESSPASVETVVFETDWGYAGLVCRGGTVLALRFGYSTRQALAADLRAMVPGAIERPGLQSRLRKALQRYFSGKPRTDFVGRVYIGQASAFGQAVLRACATIEPGHTVSYRQLAAAAGYPKAARAVGRIMAGNHCPILIPCHRVIRSDGAAGGYSAAGGLDIKRRLLAMEANG